MNSRGWWLVAVLGCGGGGATGAREVWSPAVGTTWQWQLSGSIDTSRDVAMYDVDLFEAPQGVIDALHGQGKVVVCYFSAGTYEDFREDAARFDARDYGKALPEWPGEFWLDVRAARLRPIMEERLDLAVEKRCDGVEPDNVDGYQNDTGFALGEDDQLAYNRWLAQEAHERGLSVGLKNALGLVEALEPDFEWALNEECFAYDECRELRPFIEAGKAVFHVEYVDDLSDAPALRDRLCGDPLLEGFSTLVKGWDLGSEWWGCP